jgi:hypothetical protein
MQHLQTNAADLSALLQEIRDFTSANGWSILSDGTGGGGMALELTNSNGHSFKFTGAFTARTDYLLNPFDDYYLRIQLEGADIGATAGYDVNRWSDTNDLTGPFPNVWLYTDDAGTFCHVIAQVATRRFTHFSFGDLNNRGLHAVDIPYAVGMFQWYWQHIADYINNFNSNFNNWSSNAHAVGHFGDGSGNASRYCTVGIPDGVVDPLLGFTDGPIQGPNIWQTNHRYIENNYVNGQNVHASFTDYFMSVDNQGHTGGTPIFPLPILTYPNDQSAMAYLGELHYVGIVGMTGLAPGQILDFAGEEWMCFPIMQYGTRAAAVGGSSPLPQPNSLNYGLAYRKV